MNAQRLLQAIAAMITVLFVSIGVSANDADNLMANGSFEELKGDGFPSRWLTNYFNDHIDISAEEKEVAHGSRSIRITGTRSSQERWDPRGGVRQVIDVPGDPMGTRYRFRALYRTENVTDPSAVRIRFYFSDVANSTIEQLNADSLFRIVSTNAQHRFEANDKHFHIEADELAEGEWKEIDVTFVAPFGTARMFFSMFLWHHTGTVWYDNVRLERVLD